MSKLQLPEIAGHRQGDYVWLTQRGLDHVRGFGPFELGKSYILEHDGTGVSPWFIKHPRHGNRVYLDPERHLKPSVPAVPEVTQREVTVYKYIVLDQKVGNGEVGAHYEVISVNLNGSYIVRFSEYSNMVVAPEKCHPWVQGGTKRVSCRHPSFSLGLDGPVYPEGYQVKQQLNQSAPKPFQIQEASKRVKKQKEVAQELMEKAYIMSPTAFLAGGALRNWHLGMEANDLDIFVRKPYQASESQCKLAMELMGVIDVFNKATESSPGVWKKPCKATRDEEKRASDQRIEFVLEGQYMGETVQFIFLEHGCSTGLTYCHHYFDTSINMISATLDSKGKLCTLTSPRFEDSMKTGVIFVQENGSAYGNGDHLERIHSYFPEAPMVREKYREDVLRNPMKAWELAEDWEDLI